MPLFEFGAARQLEGDTTEPNTESGRIAQVIEDNLDGLVGEQVFPVVRADSPDEPYLIALDPSGAPVVVEVVQTLDSATLIRSLDHAGAAGRMTRGQLAGHYPGGTQAFLHHLAAFMDSVPVKRARLPRSGSRLIIICEESAEEVLNAVDFLRQPAMPVEVIRMDLVNGLGGRRFIDLSPLVINPDSAPDHPRLFGSAARLEPARPKNHPPSKSDLRAALAAAQRAVARAESVIASGVGHDAGGSAAAESSAAADSAGRTQSATPPAGPKLETRRARRERLAAERADARAAERTARQAAARREAAAPQSEPTLVISGLPDAFAPTDIGGAHAEHLATGLQSGQPIPRDWQPHAMPAGLTIDGVLAAGTDISDPLSWDTAQLPVVVRPMATGPVQRVPTATDATARRDDRREASLPVAATSGPTVRRTPIAEVAASRPIPLVGIDRPTAPISDSGPDSDGGPSSDAGSGEDAGLNQGAGRTSPAGLDQGAETRDQAAETDANKRGRHSLPGRPAAEGGLTPIDDRPDADLIALAGQLGEPTQLIWERPRRRQRFAATLDASGTIHVPEVGKFKNPDAAARAAAGSQFADGWTVWRVHSADGLTLREALEAA